VYVIRFGRSIYALKTKKISFSTPLVWQNYLRNEGFVSQDHIKRFSTKWECTNTHTYKHTISYIKFKLKLLQIKCHVLEFIKNEAQKMLQKIIEVFAEAFVSHDRHILLALQKSGPPRTTYTCKSQYGTQPSSIWISHWQLSSASPEEGGRSSPAHKYIKTIRIKPWATTLNKTYPSWLEGHEF
jgi:hypothetical protein